jgi:Flp pilus assembly pilin Flp
MKKHIHLIIFFLCLCLVGFFANFAQNNYGLTMVNYSLLAVALLSLDMMRISIIKYKIAGCFIYLMVLYPVMAVFVDLQDIGEEFLMVYVLSMLAGFIYNAIVLPVVLFFKERKLRSDEISFLNYYELLFLSVLLVGFNLKSNHYPGAGPTLSLSVLIVIPALIRLVQLIKLLISGKYLSAVFQLLVFVFISLTMVGTVFKMQHWPGANSLLDICKPVMFISVLLLLFITYFKKGVAPFTHINQGMKTAYFSLCATIIWLTFHSAGIAPSIYSDRYPKGMQMLGAKANGINAEGKEFEKRYEIYFENLEHFVEEQNKAEK